MDKIIDYQILAADDSIKLAAMVRDAIKSGWAPYGGLQNRSYHENGVLLQPMVRYDDSAKAELEKKNAKTSR